MKKVTIIQDHLPVYRVAFYHRLKDILDEFNVKLGVCYGRQFSNANAIQMLPWATPVQTRRFRALTWQSVSRHCRSSDLVICPQQVRHPASILLQLSRGPTARKHAFWGHGRNLTAGTTTGPAESLKRFLSTRVDWWFAYNDFSARIIEQLGYPNERITNIQNSVDTTSLKRRLEGTNAAEIEQLKKQMGIHSENVAVYTGALRAPKRIDFLLKAADAIRNLLTDFHLIILGDGEDRDMLSAFASTRPWIHWEGPKHDIDKVPYWALSKLLLMPGGVGLVVLDSFALGIPMVTTENRFHGPEIDYLDDGFNGLIVRPGDDPAHYAHEVAALLQDDTRRESMAAAALAKRDRYSSEDMAQRFAEGVLKALDAPQYRVWI